MDVNRRILMAVAEVDVWVLAARRVGVIVALLVGAAAVLCGVAWIAGRGRGRPLRRGPLSSRLRRSTFPRGEGLGTEWGSINPKAGKLPMKGRKIGTEGRNDGR